MGEEKVNLPQVTRAGADSSLIQNDIQETLFRGMNINQNKSEERCSSHVPITQSTEGM